MFNKMTENSYYGKFRSNLTKSFLQFKDRESLIQLSINLENFQDYCRDQYQSNSNARVIIKSCPFRILFTYMSDNLIETWAYKEEKVDLLYNKTIDFETERKISPKNISIKHLKSVEDNVLPQYQLPKDFLELVILP